MRAKLVAMSLTVVLLGTYGYASQQTRRPLVKADATRVRTPETPAKPVLLADSRGTFSVIDPANREVILRSRSGDISPSGTKIYEQHRRTLITTDLSTLQRVDRTSEPKGMEFQVASTSGRFLAFAEPHEPSDNPWIPAGRARTKITIVPTNRGDSRTYNLKGNFDVEAFSTDDRQLFLIEFMPARNPWHYGVRRLVFAGGKVREIARTKQSAPGEMNGTGRLAVFSPHGDELYTLYTQQGPNYTHTAPEEAEPGGVYAFVHLLNLEGAWTHCIDLPPPFGTGAVTSHAMAVSDDGSRLYVADPSSGGLAVIDPRTQSVLRSVTADLRSMRDGVTATVADDGTLYLGGGRRVLAFDGESLRQLRQLRLAHPVYGIATSAESSKLYVAARNRIRTIDPHSL